MLPLVLFSVPMPLSHEEKPKILSNGHKLVEEGEVAKYQWESRPSLLLILFHYCYLLAVVHLKYLSHLLSVFLMPLSLVGIVVTYNSRNPSESQEASKQCLMELPKTLYGSCSCAI